MATYDTTVTPPKWKFVGGIETGGGSGMATTTLPEWDKNIKDYKDWVDI